MENLNEQVVNDTQETTEPVSNEQTQVNSEAQTQSTSQSSESKYVPYDRFQELVHDRQESERRYKAMEERYSTLDKELQTLRTPKTEDHALISEMNKIDPRFGQYLKDLEAKAAKAGTIENDFNSYRQNQMVSSYNDSVQRLHETNKTPPEIRDFIRAQLDAKAFQGKLGLSQVEPEYKSILDAYNKVFEARDREVTKKYVTDRKKDSLLPPSQPKGTAASGKTGSKYTGDRESLLNSVAKGAVAKAKAERDL